MRTQSTTPTKTAKPKAPGIDLLAQVRAVRGEEEANTAAQVSLRNSSGGLRAYFQPISGDRRTGLVTLSAVRTREEGQVRTGAIEQHPEFADLVASIRTHGVLQPVALSWDEAQDCFWLDMGHRRVAAAQAAGLSQVPAVIQVTNGSATLGSVMTQQQLIENLQRTQLPAIDVAHGLSRLTKAGLSASEVASSIGKSKSWVSKHLKLLELPQALLAKAEAHGLGHEAIYTVAQADVAEADREKLLDIAITGGRTALGRELETKAMVTKATTPIRQKGRGGKKLDAARAVDAATKRVESSARHLLSLLEEADDLANVPRGLEQSLKNLLAVLNKRKD